MFFSINFNKYYFRHTLERVRSIQQRFEDQDSVEYSLTLAKKGRTNLALIFGLIVLVNLLYFASISLFRSSGLI